MSGSAPIFQVGRAPDNPRLAVLTAYKLGLWPLDRPKPCAGFVNGCMCGCKPKRAAIKSRPKQPWQPTKAPRLSGVQQLAFWRTKLRRGEFVYFIQGARGGAVKIGRAKDPLKRLQQLQTGSPVELELKAVIPAESDAEHRFHVRFGAMRKHGEWFDGAELPLLLTFAEAISQHMMESYDGGGEMPALPEPENPARPLAVLREARKDIERMYNEGFDDDKIAELLSGDEFSQPLGGRAWSADEVFEQLEIMGRLPEYHLPRRRPAGNYSTVRRGHDKRAYRLSPNSRAA